ncbi:MAG: hypothetical protein H0T93_02560 [Chloroflexia bacterium]|nr:hypothetical protein [Chloroflexia bacterium]
MVSKTARVRGRSVTTLLLGVIMALMAVMPFAGTAAAQDATPEATPEPTGLAALGLQEIQVTASAETYALSYTPPLVEGWALITLVNESDAPAVVNIGQLPEDASVGDLSSTLFSTFQGEGGELPEFWANTTFAGGAWAGAGETVKNAVYITPGQWAAFSTNPISVQPVQTFLVASDEDLVNIYGVEAEATPVADAAATPVVEGLPSDGTVSITDGAFSIADAPAAGPQVWEVTNDSAQVSEIVLVSVDYDIPQEEAVLWVGTFAAGDLGNAVIENGSGTLSAGASAYVAVDLAPGTYVLFSAQPDVAGGLQSDAGLVTVFVVE